MTTETDAPPVIVQIVVCDTCDLCFRAHPGRQTCPTCGGGILYAFFTLDEPAEPAADDEPVDSAPQAPGTEQQDQAPAPPAVEANPTAELPADPPPASTSSADDPPAGSSAEIEESRDRLAKTAATDAA